MATVTRYSALDYRRALIVNGTLDPFAHGAPYRKLQDADLVVCVKGNVYKVWKDRFGETREISAAQFSDIRENLPTEVFQVRG